MIVARIKGRALLLVSLIALLIVVPVLGMVLVPRLLQGNTPEHRTTASGNSGDNQAQSWNGTTPSREVRWSDPQTWDTGKVPEAGSEVTIPKGRTVSLDISPPQLGGLTIEGTLICKDMDLNLTAGWIMIHNDGALECGTEQTPFSKQLVITLTGNNVEQDIMGMGNKFLAVMGGTLDLHGLPRISWTRLNETALAGSNQLVLEKEVDWQIGQRIAIASTDYNPKQAEEVEITAVSGTVITFTPALQYTHWGQMQNYANTPVDERAEVGLLSRNIVVQGDEATVNNWFGANTAIMRDSVARIENVEFFRVGQYQRLARYPIHWHLANDASGSYAKNNSIHASYNRCITIHGTSNVLLQSNVAFDNIGHCFFLEDGIETGNTLENNLGIFTKKAEDGQELLPTDNNPATFWITNPNNTVRNNVAAGSEGVGFWYALPEHPTGFSQNGENNALVWPQRTPLGIFAGNVAHSNENRGLLVDNGPGLDGEESITYYHPRVDPTNEESESVLAVFDTFLAYKHRNEAIWLRGNNTVVTNAILADNVSGAIFASQETFLQNSLIIGETDNKGTPEHYEKTGVDGRSLPRPWAADTPLAGFQFYDGRVGVENVTFVNFQSNSLRPAGALGYNRDNRFPVDVQNFATNLQFVNANQVYLEDPGEDMDGDKAAVFQDTDGSVTGQPGKYVVANNPFLTDNTCSVQNDWNTYICTSRYAHLSIGSDDGQSVAPLTVTRDDGKKTTLVGANNTTSTSTSALLGRSYTVQMANTTSKLRLRLDDIQAGDWVKVGVPYNQGSFLVYADYYTGNKLSSVQSMSALDASSGNAYYYDSGAKMLYVKIMPRDGNDWATVFADPQ